MGNLRADPYLLRRALDNLVDHAVRHSPPLGVVKISARREDGGWLFEIADQGPGVPDDLREAVFQRFVRADSASARDRAAAGPGWAWR